MALVLYSDVYRYPDGTPAANMPAAVFVQDVSTLASLFTDVTGGTPLPNPLNTDAGGVLTFWAEEGPHWVHIDTESFLVDVGMSEESSDLSTGLASGGELDIATPTSITINALVGYVVSNVQLTQAVPTVVKVDQPTQVVALDASSLLRSITWWLMDSTGLVIQQANQPTPEQRRTHIALGVSLYDLGIGELVEVQSLPVILPQDANQLVDLMDSLGPFRLTGNRVTPNGANLSFNTSAGLLFSRASNRFISGVLTTNPHISMIAAQTPAVLRRTLRLSVLSTPPLVNTIDPTQYDLNGVLTPVGGGPSASTIQRVWLFAANTVDAQIAVQYGQATYGSLSAALAAIGSELFVPAPFTAATALLGYIVVTRTATDLSDPTQAVIVNAGKIATP